MKHIIRLKLKLLLTNLKRKYKIIFATKNYTLSDYIPSGAYQSIQ